MKALREKKLDVALLLLPAFAVFVWNASLLFLYKLALPEMLIFSLFVLGGFVASVWVSIEMWRKHLGLLILGIDFVYFLTYYIFDWIPDPASETDFYGLGTFLGLVVAGIGFTILSLLISAILFACKKKSTDIEKSEIDSCE